MSFTGDSSLVYHVTVCLRVLVDVCLRACLTYRRPLKRFCSLPHFMASPWTLSSSLRSPHH